MRGQEWYKNLYQKFDRKTDYAKAVVNLHNKRVLLAPDPVSKSTLLLCIINKNEYLSKYYLQFSIFSIFYFTLESMYRRSPAESDHLLYYPQFRNICQAGILIYFSVIYFSEKVAQAVSLQSLAPQPLIST